MEHRLTTNSQNNRLVIGIVGQPAAGKDTVAQFIADRGFEHFSSGALVREMMRSQGVLDSDRTKMYDFIQSVRRERGNGVLAEEIARKITGDAVISGIRNMAEVDVLRQKFPGEFILMAVEAPIEVRYRRGRERGRIGDNLTLDKFREEEERERADSNGSHEMDRVVDAADELIDNDGSLEELQIRIDNNVTGWQEYRELQPNRLSLR